MKKNYIELLSNLFWLFIIGSFIGFAHENLLTIIKGNFQLRQGLLLEPLIPIYGIGAIVYYLVYYKIHLNDNVKSKNILKVFLIGFLVGGLTEYLCSFVQEKLFGTISWDYSYLMLNINGRTSVFHAAFWGLIGVVFYFYILPLFNKFGKKLKYRKYKIATVILSTIFIFDAFISIGACNRQISRNNNIAPSNKIEEFYDEHFPDEYINLIYNNAKKVK